MKSTPLSQTKERFGDKAKLIEAVQKLTTDTLWLDNLNGDKGLKSVSNTKLLRLHDVLTSVKNDFGSRDKLVDAILKLENRSKDGDYRTSLLTLSTPRLLDTHGATAKRVKSAKTSAPASKAAKKPRTKKAKAKAA